MLNSQNILKALDINELPISPMNKQFWFNFKFGNLDIHIRDRNGRTRFGLEIDNSINVHGPKDIIDALLDNEYFRFYEYVQKDGEITADMTDMSDTETYQVLVHIQELVWAQPMRLERGVSGDDRAKAFGEHPVFFVRQGSHNGKMYFFDATTNKPFWKTTKVVKSEFRYNGYSCFTTESGMKYHLTLNK